MSVLRSILLVGEGNFSFSAALSRFYSTSGTIITATCLQPQEEALRQEGAAANVQTVRDSGGTVLFEVDCTKLEECAPLQGRIFDRVVFNFPHCGRKSGVKKNRQLLKNFFLSCVHVLAEDGEVHVSLCNGQGGTPADRPKREWHNSWQVAAMAAEAHLILSDVQPFESDKHQTYKCTGYRSQDKGFHVENALLHVFTRSLPYRCTQTLRVEEFVNGEEVRYDVPAELSDYISRGFLSSDSCHPVKLTHDLLLEALAEKWSVSMETENLPLLITAKQLKAKCHDTDRKVCYWIDPLEKEPDCDVPTPADKGKQQPTPSDCQRRADARKTPSAACGAARSTERVRSRGAEGSRPAWRPDGETGYLLRPTLHPQLEDLLAKKGERTNKVYSKTDGQNKNFGGNEKDKACFLSGISGLVFRNVPIHPWAQPVFHQLLLRGILPSDYKPVKLLQQKLEPLLAPHGVSMATEQGSLLLTAQPVGLVGKVLASVESDDTSVILRFNLDLLAVLLFSLPDWRLLWSHDPRLLKQFAKKTPPGTAFRPFSLFPELFSFDISFWTGPTWEEKKFHTLVREASRGTVEQVKLIDSFSHPDLSQISYCYRLVYRSHAHALSHTQALHFHKHLESLLSSRLEVTIR